MSALREKESYIVLACVFTDISKGECQKDSFYSKRKKKACAFLIKKVIPVNTQENVREFKLLAFNIQGQAFDLRLFQSFVGD